MTKKIFFSIALVLIATNLFAQKMLTGDKRAKAIIAKPVVYMDDTVYSKGTPYCLMKEIKLNDFHPDYSVKNMRGEELIYISWDTKSGVMGAYILKFKMDGKSAKLKTTEEEDLPELIVNNDLFVNNNVPADRETNFISANGGDVGGTKSTNKSNSEIIVADKWITQDLMKIGSWSLVNTYYQDKKLWHETEWFDKGGVKVAQAKYQFEDPDQAMVLTYSDNKTVQVPVGPGKSAKKMVATYLRQNGYM